MPVALRPPCVKISQRSGSAWRRHFLGVDRHDDALAAEFLGGFAHEIGVVHRRGIDRDLVGAREQQLPDVLDLAHAAADGERHEAGLGRAPHHIQQDAARLDAGGDVEKAEFVGAGGVIGFGGFHRIARIHQIDELHALDDAAILDVEARNEADFKHRSGSCRGSAAAPEPDRDRCGRHRGRGPRLRRRGSRNRARPDARYRPWMRAHPTR